MRWATVSILLLIWNWLCWRSFICSSRVTFIPSPSNTAPGARTLWTRWRASFTSDFCWAGTLVNTGWTSKEQGGWGRMFITLYNCFLCQRSHCFQGSLLLSQDSPSPFSSHRCGNGPCYRASGSVLAFVVFLLPVHCFEYSIFTKLSVNYLIWEVICFLPVPYLIHWTQRG